MFLYDIQSNTFLGSSQVYIYFLFHKILDTLSIIFVVLKLNIFCILGPFYLIFYFP